MVTCFVKMIFPLNYLHFFFAQSAWKPAIHRNLINSSLMFLGETEWLGLWQQFLSFPPTPNHLLSWEWSLLKEDSIWRSSSALHWVYNVLNTSISTSSNITGPKNKGKNCNYIDKLSCTICILLIVTDFRKSWRDFINIFLLLLNCWEQNLCNIKANK